MPHEEPEPPARRTRLTERPAFDRALRGAAVLAVLALGAAGLALPQSVLRGGAAWLAFLCFALSGWGYLIVRLRRADDPDFGLRAVWGAAGYLAIAGVLVAIGACTRPVILALLGLGAAGFAWRELVAPVATWHRVRDGARFAAARPGTALLAAVIALFALYQMLGAVAALDTNPWDDDLAYVPLIKRLLDTGDLIEPFSFRRLSAYGGQTALGALAGARGTLANVHLIDQGLFFGLVLLAVAGAARERRCQPVWLAVAMLVLVLLPDISINTAAQWTGVALFFALYRAAARDQWSMVGLAGAAACTLRQNYIAVVVLFAGLVLVQRLLGARRAMGWRAAWQAERPRWRLVAIVATAAISAWWVAALRSNGTFLFPFLPGTWNRELSLQPDVLTWADELRQIAWSCIETTPIAVMPVLVALLLLTEDERPGAPLRSLFVAGALGFLVLCHSFAGTDPAHLWRYAFGFAIALTAAFVVEVGAEHERAARLVPVGRWLLLAVLGLQILVARAPVGKRATDISRDLARASALGRRGDPSTRVERKRYAAMQAAIPAGAPVAALLDDPAFLDYRRNRFANLDTAGYASPFATVDGRPQQWPAFRGAEPVRAYFAAAGYRYLAFVRSERSRYFYRRGFWLWRLFNDYEFFQTMSAYQIDAIESFAELATTTKVLYDQDGLVVLDLEAPLRAARTREAPAGDARAGERWRRGEWIRELADREQLHAAWSLGSRTDVVFEEGFGELAFVDQAPGDPRWFETAPLEIAPPPKGDEAATLRTLRRIPLRALGVRSHLRVRGSVLGGSAMRLEIRASVSLNTVYTRPRLDVSLDGELLHSAVADERGRYTIDVTVPREQLTGDWQDVYLVFNSISEPEKELRDPRIARVESIEWIPVP